MNTTKSGLSKLALEAGFGTRVWSQYGYLAARFFHPMIATFIILILYVFLAPRLPPWTGLFPVVIYFLYYLIRHLIITHFEANFYRVRPQLLRAQAGLWGLFMLLWLLPPGDHNLDLWILFLPSLLIISRHCTTSIFFTSVIQVCLMMVGIGWLNNLSLLSPELLIPCLGLLLVTFISHYLIRNIDARDDMSASFAALEALPEPRRGDKLPAEQWQIVLETYLDIVKGTCGNVWLCDHDTRRIRPLPDFRYCQGDNCTIRKDIQCEPGQIHISADHSIAKVVRSGQADYCQIKPNQQRDTIRTHSTPIQTCILSPDVFFRIMIPIIDPAASQEYTIGVLCIDFNQKNSPRPDLLPDYYDFLSGLARRVRPILHHLQQIEELKVLQHLGQRVSSSLKLEKILDDAVKTVVETFGFEFATLSLVNIEQNVIRTVAGYNISPEWIKAAVHSLDSQDIQADVIRWQRQEVLKGWDPRFDSSIWEKFNHKEMIRIFTPIGGVDGIGQKRAIGTIEAGYYTTTRPQISLEQRHKLNVLARHLFTAIENANLFAQTQRHAESLASLHQIGWKVALARDLARVLDEIGDNLQKVLRADIVMLYRYDPATQMLEPPRIFGEIIGKSSLRLPSPDEGIVATVLSTRKPYYASDAKADPLLTPPGLEEKYRTFTKRQEIVSVAGVPMIASGTPVGVLCVNYRKPHLFSENYRQALEIAAQFAAVALHNAEMNEVTEELITSRERMQLATKLHHSLMQYLSATQLMAETAQVQLHQVPEKTEQQLQKIRNAVTNAMNELRINIFELNAKGLAHCSLPEALQDYVREAKDFFNLNINLSIDFGTHAHLPLPIARELLLVCREGIANIAQHAQAKQVDLELKVVAQTIFLAIRDDGRGFEPTPTNNRGRRGLAMIRDQINELNGEFEVVSSPGQGSLLQVKVPLFLKGDSYVHQDV